MCLHNRIVSESPPSYAIESIPYCISKLNNLLRKKKNSQIVKQFVIKYPEILQIPDNDGWLPLHLACWYCQSLDVIQMLLRLYPQAAEVSQKDGYLPLHLACYNRSSIDTAKLLLEAYPRAVEVKNVHGDLPLHIACMVDHSSHKLIAMLVDMYPKATEVQNNYGDLPVHWACHKNASIEIINMLVDAFPQSITIKNKGGWLPQDVASNTEMQFLAKKGRLLIPDVNPFDKKIYIKNRTGRQLKIEFHHSSLNFQSDHHDTSHGDRDNGAKFSLSRKQGKFGNCGEMQDLIIEPNEKSAFPVNKGCKGLYFNILCCSDTSKGWVLNHFIHGGRTQQVTGQPFQIRGE